MCVCGWVHMTHSVVIVMLIPVQKMPVKTADDDGQSVVCDEIERQILGTSYQQQGSKRAAAVS